MKADHPSPLGYQAAAWLLSCEEAAMRAVGEVEAGDEGAFLPSDEPVILFERHKFDKWTDGRFRGERAPGLPREVSLLSSQERGGYGTLSQQHVKLHAAIQLDRDAAIRSCSWGLFQILGENHEAAGYPNPQRFVNAMYRSADDHLRALVMFLRHDERLVDALRAHDWPTFARIYNGPRFAEHNYDGRLAGAYARLAANTSHEG